LETRFVTTCVEPTLIHENIQQMSAVLCVLVSKLLAVKYEYIVRP